MATHRFEKRTQSGLLSKQDLFWLVEKQKVRNSAGRNHLDEAEFPVLTMSLQSGSDKTSRLVTAVLLSSTSDTRHRRQAGDNI